MARTRLAPVLLGLLSAAAAAEEPPPGWTAEELELLDRGLEALNVDRADLGFQKRPIDDPFRLPVVDRALDDPLSVAGVAEAWDARVRTGDAAEIVHEAWRTLPQRLPSRDDDAAPEDALSALLEAQLPASAHAPLRRLLAAIGSAQRIVAADLSGAGEARDALLEGALGSQVEKPILDLAGEPLEQDALLETVQRTYVDGALESSMEILDATAVLVAALRQEPSPGAFDVAAADTAVGRVLIYGTGDDGHDDLGRHDGMPVVLAIDLGGNDTYAGGGGASVARGLPVCVVIDVGGDDRYVGREDLSFGAALGGVSVQWDAAGNDVYDAGHASLGVGVLGVGVLVDDAGDDTYRCRDLGIGAGAFGVGLLLDRAGNDIYHADLFGQGFASTWGVGVLGDLAGNDVYDAGGTHLHAPLFRDRFQSLSQGFSIGMRPDASGGVGVLVDVSGNDRYACDIYGQGASYWYALGILVDDDGNDTYTLGQYGQGAGIHLAAGILLDRAGQDLYYDMHGVGQGGAHDYSVGFLLDRGGDDYYAGSGGSQGAALANSVGALIDSSGNDSYAAAKIDLSQGSAASARGSGGIALLLDGGGRDLYSELRRDRATWTKDWAGVGIDRPDPEAAEVRHDQAAEITPEAARAQVEEEGRTPGSDGAPEWDLDKLWTIASRWEVGDNRVVVPVARERLVALGAPALDRAVERLGTKDGLEFRAVETTLAAFPAAEVLPRVLERTGDPDPRVRRGAVRALGSLKDTAAGDPAVAARLAELLADPDVRGTALGALTSLRSAPPGVAELLASEKQFDGVAAATCLGAVRDPAALDALVGALDRPYAFPVRIAAEQQLAAAGDAAVPLLASVVADPARSLVQRRAALRALGRTKSAAAVAPLLAALSDPDALLRTSAVFAAEDLLAALPAEAQALAPTLEAARDSAPAAPRSR